MTRNFCRKLISIVLCVSFIIGIFCLFSASAAESSGTINSDKVNIRTGAGTDFSVLKDSGGNNIQLSTGHNVTVLQTVKAENDKTYVSWYKIKFTYNKAEYTGYAYSQYVTITPDEHDYTMPDGVPEEYKPYIENILKYYPKWKFVFYDTGLEWSSLFSSNQQGYPGRSLIPASSPISYRSTESGCYDWRKDSWVMQDAGGWYQANAQTIAYYMDPRNFLNINDVFMFESLSYDKTTQTLDGVEKILEGSFMDGVKIKNTDNKSITYAQAYIEAAEKTKVSPYHLASRTIQEVGKGGSNSVKGQGAVADDSGTLKYKGYYNFYNIGASQGDHPIANGLKYASGETSSAANKEKYMLPWDSQYKAIVGGAIWIGNGYINSIYKQNTMYFQKFNTSGGNASHQYMGNILAPYYEAKTIRNLYNELGILNKSFTFIIPYYKNMPKTACKLPSSSNANPNNWLNALYFIDNSTDKDYISGFDGATLNWDVGTLKSNSFTVKATPQNSHAKVSGVGKITLKEGKNTVKVVVTAENGDKRTYSITVNVTESPPVTEPPTPSSPDIVIGDVDMNGKIEIADALYIFKHKSGEKTLSANAQKAADTNKNGNVDIGDALFIFKYKSGEISKF